MKRRKLSTALVVGIVMILVAMTAIAAVLLSGRDFVQDVMQPMAQDSQSDSWNEEEVQEILRIAQENGLELTEAQRAKLLDRGGYYKEELMRLFMKLDLGDYPSTWSIEDQAWYGQMLVDIGLYDETYYALPGEDEATEAQALAAVRARVEEVEPGTPLDDAAIYRRHTTYQWTAVDDDAPLEKQWYVAYEPLDLSHTTYRFSLDTGANILNERWEPGIANRDDIPRPEQLRFRYEELYGYFYDWTMEIWVEFMPMLRQSIAAHGISYDESLALLALSEFAVPEAGAIPEDAAIDAAGFPRDKAYAVYLLGEDVPVWKVTLPDADGYHLAEIDARTGAVRGTHFSPYGADSITRSYMLESVYQANVKPLADGILRFDNRRYEAVTPLADGDFLLVGSTWLADDNTRGWAARVAPDGRTRWEVIYKEGRSIDEAVELSDGRLLLAMEPTKGEHFSLAVATLSADGGRLTGPTTLDTLGWAYKGKDCLLIQRYIEGTGTRPTTMMAVDADGNVLWDRTYDALLGAGFHTWPAADGYLLAGGAQDYPFDQTTLTGHMGRLDDEGNLLWDRRMEDYPRTGISSFLETADGGMYGAGMNYGKYEDDAEDYARLSDFVVRFDAQGNVLWCRYYPELNPEVGIMFEDLLPAPDGGVLVVARSLEGNDWSLVHLDGDGNVQKEWKPALALMDFVWVNTFTAGGQSYMIYWGRAGYPNAIGPINTYITPIVWPEG